MTEISTVTGERAAVAVRMDGGVCHIAFDRPEANNAINARLVADCHAALDACEAEASVVVLSGSAETFCFGADFAELSRGVDPFYANFAGPGPMFDLWQRMATGPYVTLSYVRGKVNAGGMGFLGASDIVLADTTARFSLSEMLFGLYPACVMPFLVRRTGFQRAHYLTLSTQPIDASTALAWGLADAIDEQGDMLLRRHLRQLARLSKTAVARYKTYATGLGPDWKAHRERAIQGNLDVFEDPANRAAITRYIDEGLFPWE
ncbi:MAG: putative polyketide biosynthesis enoyl-CoA hydratase PksH [Luteibacter sp.]|uniref:enoyl-CoA hydratase/isomerase n=1 Tax=Luteibacter sp. TaxID=1886636 RepID=UPI00137FD635|nr:enoyl-CoA hydratase/isomerase [Luteibacter sp.]KAF1007430.1 MAG: putative polyketide biosynthesis enoyl-CoA hydratase PksH [Luteibacter sp.]